MRGQEQREGGAHRPLPTEYARLVKKFANRVNRGQCIISLEKPYEQQQYDWVIAVMEGRSRVA